MINRKDLCLKLSRIRISKDISARELSLRLGKDPTYIGKVESGKVNISLDILNDICLVLGVDVNIIIK